MVRPLLTASDSDIAAFTRDWVRHAAKHGLDEALLFLDGREDIPAWSEAFVRSISDDHFGDGNTCVISDPDVIPELSVNVFRYDDESGFTVDHDLAMNDQRSDFTAQFEFIRKSDGFNIYLTDIHVL